MAMTSEEAMRMGFLAVAGTGLLLLALGPWLWPPLLWAAAVVLPLVALGFHDMLQTRHSIRRNFPLFGRARWLMEALRPFMRQYFVESDTDGAPINRMFRSIVYQRAKGELESVPFGTRVNVYRDGYEWIGHSVSAIRASDVLDLRVTVGGPDCSKPYRASILNISAMSFGALSRNAILALNRGARMGGFAHNTGEGGLTPFHLEHGGDLVWQIGTGYFGCRDIHGNFAPETFREKSAIETVRMIEIKLSQGAKPGHGGILPAEKNTPEIAAIRGVVPGTQVDSPPSHSAFDSPLGLLEFVARLRELSGGKPIGFKLAIGRKSEFIAICKAMVETGITPDFVTVDGGEGGTGAAPLEYANSVGMPLREAVAFVDDCLSGFGLRRQVRVIASGKILTAFHVVKNLALGADLCNSARGMMLALGCVHSLICNTNHCPSGVATQDPSLYRGLVVPDKARRVAQFHAKTVHATADLIASAGLFHTSELTRTHIYRRVDQAQIRRYDEIFPYVSAGALRQSATAPAAFSVHLEEADPERFMPRYCLTTTEDPCQDPHRPCTPRQPDGGIA
ncbi:FMN-binding glutamate synthase family protein [Thioalkalivibrio sp.]|uniref:FMN-binding glutamate synthase family protein n=1 Tax=Thioalkalivibrio sp. TaxID=2093813 RepID=UPI003977057C